MYFKNVSIAYVGSINKVSAAMQRQPTATRPAKARFSASYSNDSPNGKIQDSYLQKNSRKWRQDRRTNKNTRLDSLAPFFTPRQLLIHGTIAEISDELAQTKQAKAGCLLGLGRLADWDSRSCAWMWHGTNEKGNQTFTNQALNTLFSYSGRAFSKIRSVFELSGNPASSIPATIKSTIEVVDARDIQTSCDIWITDPPYADAINYHELGDFFLAWHDKQLAKAFPEFPSDSRSELAVRGDGEEFRRSMVEVYKNLSRNMPDNGIQMVMFTHQDPGVWADLGMILWAAGLKATAAWTISTETEAAGIKGQLCTRHCLPRTAQTQGRRTWIPF